MWWKHWSGFESSLWLAACFLHEEFSKCTPCEKSTNANKTPLKIPFFYFVSLNTDMNLFTISLHVISQDINVTQLILTIHKLKCKQTKTLFRCVYCSGRCVMFTVTSAAFRLKASLTDENIVMRCATHTHRHSECVFLLANLPSRVSAAEETTAAQHLSID